MTYVARLALICAVLLTSFALGGARGQLLTGQTVVLCAGGSVTVAAIGANGAPVNHTQVCPDMAPVFLAGYDSPVVLPPPTSGPATSATPNATSDTTTARVPVRQARGPPAGLLA